MYGLKKKKISGTAFVTVISRTDIDLLLNDLSRSGSDAESVRIKQLQVTQKTHWHRVHLAVSIHKHVDILSSKCLCAADRLHGKHGCFSFMVYFCLAQVAIIMEIIALFCFLWLYSPARFDVETRHAFIGDQSGQVTILKLEQDICSLVTTFKGHTGTSTC